MGKAMNGSAANAPDALSDPYNTVVVKKPKQDPLLLEDTRIVSTAPKKKEL